MHARDVHMVRTNHELVTWCCGYDVTRYLGDFPQIPKDPFPTISPVGRAKQCHGTIHSMKSTAGFSFYHSPDILEERCVMGEGLFITIIQ